MKPCSTRSTYVCIQLPRSEFCPTATTYLVYPHLRSIITVPALRPHRRRYRAAAGQWEEGSTTCSSVDFEHIRTIQTAYRAIPKCKLHQIFPLHPDFWLKLRHYKYSYPDFLDACRISSSHASTVVTVSGAGQQDTRSV